MAAKARDEDDFDAGAVEERSFVEGLIFASREMVLRM